jgi:hypothetical protein
MVTYFETKHEDDTDLLLGLLVHVVVGDVGEFLYTLSRF